MALAAIGAAAPAFAGESDSCALFKWDVTRERALFAGQGASVTAGKDLASAPVIFTDHLYELRLLPQEGVAFVTEPAKKKLIDGAFAGLTSFKVATPGNYRVAADVPFWIDVVGDGKLAPTRDYQGVKDCNAPHKIVEIDLSEGGSFVLQVSGSAQATVRVTVTKVPPGQSAAKS